MKKIAILAVLILCFVLSGCNGVPSDSVTIAGASSSTGFTIIEGRPVSLATSKLSLSRLSSDSLGETGKMLSELKKLRTVELGEVDKKLDGDSLRSFTDSLPDIQFVGTAEMLGKRLDINTESFDFSGCSSEDAEDIIAALPYFIGLKEVELGSDTESGFDFETIERMEKAAPQAHFSYAFTFCGQELTLDTKKLNFSQIKMDDDGEAVVKLLRCMQSCDYLDMDSCGVDNEHMAAIRDEFPEIEVVWRVWFGRYYSVRTNVERIVASDKTPESQLDDTMIDGLQYCTKVRFLDLGHNFYLTDISFVSNMPDLEVFILCEAIEITDISPLANCEKLEYLELISCEILEDISPLANLHNLKHLNIGCMFKLEDMSPLFELTQLERLWISLYNTKIPKWQIQRMRELAPNCDVCSNNWDPTDIGWRYTVCDDPVLGTVLAERYELLREQMQYEYGDISFYAFSWNDPYYSKRAPTPEE